MQQVAERSAFSRRERKAALWALIVAAALAASTVLLQPWSEPSLGPWSGDQAAVSMPDVLDAQPITVSSL